MMLQSVLSSLVVLILVDEMYSYHTVQQRQQQQNQQS